MNNLQKKLTSTGFFMTVIVVCFLALLVIFYLTVNVTAKSEPYFPDYRTKIVFVEGYKCIQYSIYNRENNTITDGLLLIEGVEK